MTDNIINIALCFDENMWKEAAVTITSILVNAEKETVHHIYCVVSKNVSMKNREMLLSVAAAQSQVSKIIFIEAPGSYENSVCIHAITTAMYTRLMLHSLLPDIEKIIYLDIDVIVRQSLAPFYNTDIKEYFLGACLDVLNISGEWNYFDFNNFVLPLKKGFYINSGVLLMNLKKIREENIDEKWVALSTDSRLKFPDQDILNSTCMDKIKFLPIKYNILVSSIEKYYTLAEENILDISYVKEHLANPAILHFAGQKPWKAKVAFYEEWWYYASMTPFKDFFIVNFLTEKLSLIHTALERETKDRSFYLFKLFTFLKIRRKYLSPTKFKVKYLLFGFLPIFESRN